MDGCQATTDGCREIDPQYRRLEAKSERLRVVLLLFTARARAMKEVNHVRYQACPGAGDIGRRNSFDPKRANRNTLVPHCQGCQGNEEIEGAVIGPLSGEGPDKRKREQHNHFQSDSRCNAERPDVLSLPLTNNARADGHATEKTAKRDT